ncbi:MAG: hypothetical protein H7X97_00890 [Opitutaceae bacterium]|nr:hypothetical protein [Verrucomicrobiales bacterium]
MRISRQRIQRQRGLLMTELMVAMAILLVAIIPVGYSFVNEQKLARASYLRAVAMEIVDGELEVLAAGEWRHHPEGSLPFKVRADAAVNLPKGGFLLTRKADHLRLEWIPEVRDRGGSVWREAKGR